MRHFALLLALSAIAASGPSARADTPRPNVVVVINDDQSWFEAGAYGGASIPTPHFDRLAQRGVLFNHGYTSCPSCAPSRASLLTGRQFWELGQGAFIQAWLPPEFPVLPDLLEAAGYRTGYTGKGWGPGVLGPGRTRNPAGQAFNAVKRNPPEDGIGTVDYVGNLAAFLDAGPADRPFYFWVGVTEPHAPHAADNHAKLGTPVDDVRVPAFLPDTPGVRRHRANYLYEVRHADETLGAVLNLLERRGQLANTLVIATADNGTAGPRMKAEVYDAGLRVPLAAMWPDRVSGGRRVDDFVNFADLAPTILEAAGAPVPAAMSGRSALGVLLSPASGRVDAARTWTAGGLEWHGTMHAALAARTIRDDRYRYVVNHFDAPVFDLPDRSRLPDGEYARTAATADAHELLVAHPGHPSLRPFLPLLQAPRPREELYDCFRDPWQLTNLAASPEHAAVKARLRATLEAHQRRTRDPRATGDMATFERTLRYVQDRKRNGYKDRAAP